MHESKVHGPAHVRKRTELSPEDGMLVDGAEESQADMLMATRAIVAAASGPGVAFTVDELARAANLSRGSVLRVLSAPECRELLTQACGEQVALVIPKAVASLARILDDGKIAPDVKVRAAKVAFEGYKMLAEVASGATQAQVAAMNQKYLEGLKAMAGARRITVEAVETRP